MTNKMVVQPHLWEHRMRVAEAYDQFLHARGLTKTRKGDRAPWGCIVAFLQKSVTWRKEPKCPPKALRRWHRSWVQGGREATRSGGTRRKAHYGAASVATRVRGPGLQGRPVHCNWVREALYEWFVSMRYSIDWKKYDAALRSRGAHKAMGRCQMALLRAKA
jgi:hypothetical protein